MGGVGRLVLVVVVAAATVRLGTVAVEGQEIENVWPTAAENKAWEKVREVTLSGDHNPELMGEVRAEVGSRIEQARSFGEDQLPSVLQSTYQNYGLDSFTKTLSSASALDAMLRKALHPTGAGQQAGGLESPTAPIPGSPAGTKPMMPAQAVVKANYQSAGEIYRNLLANTQQMMDAFATQPNLLLDVPLLPSAPEPRRARGGGPRLEMGDEVSELAVGETFLELGAQQLPIDDADRDADAGANEYDGEDEAPAQDERRFFGTAPLAGPTEPMGAPSAPSAPSLPGLPSLPSLPSLPFDPSDPSNTAKVAMFHLIPLLIRSTYQVYKDLGDEEKLKLFGRDYTKPKITKEPPKYSRDGVLPKEVYEGYDTAYYSRMQDIKPLKMWWGYDGTTPPPWFTNNAPPNRPHFMRSPVPVPKPPFKSPFNKQMFNKGYFQQTPPAWPTLHHVMVQGQQPGEGSMKCPCPGNPTMMCDCNSIEFEQINRSSAEEEAKKKKQEGFVTSSDDPWTKVENAFVENVLQFPNLEATMAMYAKP